MWLIEYKLPKLEEFDLHRVTDHFSCGFDANDGVIGSHVVIDVDKIGFSFECFLDIEFLISFVEDSLFECGFLGWDECFKIHEIFSESSSLIETWKRNSASCDDFVRINTKQFDIFQFFDSIDNSKGHTDRQSGRDSDDNQIEKFHENSFAINYLWEMVNHTEVGDNGN